MPDSPDRAINPTASLGGETYQRTPFGESSRDAGFEGFPDCAVTPGEIHEYGCDWEECPRCGDQFAFCECHRLPSRTATDEAPKPPPGDPNQGSFGV